jgi:chemosensory pili system protein ChpA (sensor histidine kinase/response regulator)
MITAPKEILILEDEKDIRDVIRDFLESESYKVETASNGIEALKYLSQSKMPDLILLDMKMPEMDGWGFATEFYSKYNHSAPLLVMTAAAEVEERAQEVRANDYLGKPFDLEELSQKIKKLLEKPEKFSSKRQSSP